MDGQLDHLFLLEFDAGDVDQQVADALVRCGREFDDEGWVESVDGADEILACFPLLAVCLVRLVEDDDGAEHFEDVVEAVLDGAVVGCAFEVGIALQEFAVAEGVVAVGEEGGIAPRIAEHPQEFLPLLPVGSGQHEKHYAQVVGGVRAGEDVVLFEELDAPAACALQHLAIRMFAVSQRGLGLRVDGPRGGDPQGQAGLAADASQGCGRQQGLAAASGDFEADVGDRASCAVGAAGVRAGRFGDGAGFRKALPGGLGVVADVVRSGASSFLVVLDIFLRLDPCDRKRVEPAGECFQCGDLVFFEFHGSQV